MVPDARTFTLNTIHSILIHTASRSLGLHVHMRASPVPTWCLPTKACPIALTFLSTTSTFHSQQPWLGTSNPTSLHNNLPATQQYKDTTPQ